MQKEYIFPPKNLLYDYVIDKSVVEHNKRVHEKVLKVIQNALEEYFEQVSVVVKGLGANFATYDFNVIALKEKFKYIPTYLLKNISDTLNAKIKGGGVIAFWQDKTNRESNCATFQIPQPKKQKLGLKKGLEEGKFENELGLPSYVSTFNFENVPLVDNLFFTNALIVGGPTQRVDNYLYSMIASFMYKYTPKTVRVLVVDQKNRYSFTENTPHMLFGVNMIDLEQFFHFTKWVKKENERRLKLLEENKVSTLYQYNKRADNPLEYIVVIVREFSQIRRYFGDSSFDICNNIESEVENGRKTGIIYVLATTSTPKDVFTISVRAAIKRRVAFKTVYPFEPIYIFGHSDSSKLFEGDDCFARYIDDKGKVLHARMQLSCVSEDEMRSVCNFLKSNCEGEFNRKLYYDLQQQAIDGRYTAKELEEQTEIEVFILRYGFSTTLNYCIEDIVDASQKYNKYSVKRAIEALIKKKYIEKTADGNYENVITKKEFYKTYNLHD